MVQDYFPWNQNAEQQYQYQNRSIQSLLNYDYYRQEPGNCSSSSVMNIANPNNHAPASTYNYTLEQLRLPDWMSSLNPVGLKLENSPELVSWMERQLNPPRTTRLRDSRSQRASEKPKPTITPVHMLKIGSWERVARNASDVVAKCYFAKKKLVWEILEGRLKSKIEVQWCDIIAIDACIDKNEPGVLRVELKECPCFYQEKDPQPRKHTIWMATSDFTGGEASKCRRHEIVFPAGNLDKPYEKLLLSDQRLSLLSRKPFPSLQDPYFPPMHHFCRHFYPHPQQQQQLCQLSSPSPISGAMWGELMLLPQPYDTSAAGTIGNQYLVPQTQTQTQRMYYDSTLVASLSDGNINSRSSNVLDTEISSQFSGSVSEGSSSSGDKDLLMRQRLEILGNLEIAHDAIPGNGMFNNNHHHHQQQSGLFGYPYPVGGNTADPPGITHFDSAQPL